MTDLPPEGDTIEAMVPRDRRQSSHDTITVDVTDRAVALERPTEPLVKPPVEPTAVEPTAVEPTAVEPTAVEPTAVEPSVSPAVEPPAAPAAEVPVAPRVAGPPAAAPGWASPADLLAWAMGYQSADPTEPAAMAVPIDLTDQEASADPAPPAEGAAAEPLADPHPEPAIEQAAEPAVAPVAAAVTLSGPLPIAGTGLGWFDSPAEDAGGRTPGPAAPRRPALITSRSTRQPAAPVVAEKLPEPVLIREPQAPAPVLERVELVPAALPLPEAEPTRDGAAGAPLPAPPDEFVAQVAPPLPAPEVPAPEKAAPEKVAPEKAAPELVAPGVVRRQPDGWMSRAEARAFASGTGLRSADPSTAPGTRSQPKIIPPTATALPAPVPVPASAPAPAPAPPVSAPAPRTEPAAHPFDLLGSLVPAPTTAPPASKRLPAVGREAAPKHGASASTGDWADPSQGAGGSSSARWRGSHRGGATSTWRRTALAVALSGAGVCAAVLAAGTVAFADRVPHGTTIGGVDVGGRSRSAAVEALSAATSRAGQPFTVTAAGRSVTIDPARAGLAVNPAASVDAVLGSRFDLGRLWREVVGGGSAPTLPAPNRPSLVAALQDLAKGVDVPAVEGGVRFTPDGPQRVTPAAGSALDVAAAADLVATHWLQPASGLQLPVRASQPRITQAEADRALTQLAQPAVSGPLTLAVGPQTVIVPAATLTPTLSLVPSASAPDRLELAVDGAALRAAVLALAPKVETPAMDARIVVRGNAPVVIPATDGTRLEATALAAAAKAALLTPQRRAVVVPVVAAPRLSTDAVNALGVKEKVSTFSTVLTSNAVRTSNLRIAARTVNGTLVMPGATFSLNQVLGKRTPEKGYQQAPVINGSRLALDYGGGVSQLATTIYNAVFFAGLEDVRHQAHSLYISRYPEGREATVSYPTVDLVWRNDSRYAVLVQADVTSTVNVSFWSTKVYDVVAEKTPRTNPRQPKTVYDNTSTCVAQGANPGFDVTVRRKLYRDGALVKTQSWTTTYRAEDHVVCGPKPSTVTGTPSD